jgi:branched-chain amino acid transport system substrate-binding protein
MRKFILAAAMAVAMVTPSAPASAADPVRIGVALSQTGNLADSAAPYFKGLDLWREQANARGGLAGRPIEFVVYDDRSDPATAARLYEKLITDD